MHNRRLAETLAITSRRNKVAELFLRGITNQFEICAKLGMDPAQRSTVSRDLDALDKQWKASGVRDLDAAKGQELERLEALEREYWAAWEQSKTERQLTRTKRRTGGGSEPRDEAEMKKERRDGNPAFLDGVLKCITKRCSLLGLDAPVKQEITGARGAPIQIIRIEGAAGVDGAGNAQ